MVRSGSADMDGTSHLPALSYRIAWIDPSEPKCSAAPPAAKNWAETTP